MKKFTHWIAAKFIRDYDKVENLKVRARYGSLEGWTSIIINNILFIIKIFIGFTIRSVSLIADAINSLSDSVISVVVILGFKLAKKPSDKEHPFGHERMESVVALIISIVIFVLGIELLKTSIESIVHPKNPIASYSIIFIIIGTAIIKELLARFSFTLGDIIDSKALKADGLNHRGDVLATMLVVVALIASRFGYNRIDGIMGAAVSLIILYSAYSMAKQSINPLIGEGISEETIKEIERIAKKFDGVLGVHDIIFNRYGNANIISFHIEVSDKEDIIRLHALSEEIEDEIVKKFGGMAIVHLDPINKDHPRYEEISAAIKGIIAEDERILSFHELRIVGAKLNRCNAVFDIALKKHVDEQESYDIINSFQRKFKKTFPEMKTIIKAEPKYAYNT